MISDLFLVNINEYDSDFDLMIMWSYGIKIKEQIILLTHYYDTGNNQLFADITEYLSSSLDSF